MTFMVGSIDQPPSDAIDATTAPTTPIAPIDTTWVVKAWLELGWQQCELADWQAALASFAQVLAVDPGSVLARQGQATALNGLGLYAEAILAAELALDRSPDRSPGSPDRSPPGSEACPIADSADLWGCYGKALLGMGRLEEALSAFGQALDRAGDSSTWWLESARVWMALECYEEVVAACDRVLGLGSIGSEAAGEFAAPPGVSETVNYDGSESWAASGSRTRDNLALAWLQRGLALKKLGQTERALSSCEQATAIAPELSEAWNQCGLLLEELGRHGAAILAYDRALMLDETNPHLWNNLGIAFETLHRHADALAAFRQSLERDPHAPDVWNNCGLALEGLARGEPSLDEWNDAIATLGEPGGAPGHANGPGWDDRPNPDPANLDPSHLADRPETGWPDSDWASSDWADSGRSATGNPRPRSDRPASASPASHTDPLAEPGSEPPSGWGRSAKPTEAPEPVSAVVESARPIDPDHFDPVWATEAIQAYERAIELTGGRYWKAAANAGWVLFRLEGYGSALRVWAASLAALNLAPADQHLGAAILHYHTGRAHNLEADRQAQPEAYWQAALESFGQALDRLDAAADTDWYLEIIRCLMETHRHLGQDDAADAWLRTGSELLRRLVRETDSTARKIELASQLASFGR